MPKYCMYCCNATVEPKLNIYNDLSYISVGNTDGKHNFFIRSGDSRPTVLVISEYNEKYKQNIDVAIYKMNYCPNCGRKLIENNK